MKQIINKLKKYFCLMLGISLLASNVQIFGQEIEKSVIVEDQLVRDRIITDMENFISISDDINKLEKDMLKLEKIIENPQNKIDKMMHLNPFLRETTAVLNMDIRKLLWEYRTIYERYALYVSSLSNQDVMDKEKLLMLRYIQRDNEQLIKESESISKLFPEKIFNYDYLIPDRDLYNGKIFSIQHRQFRKIDGDRAVSIYKKDFSQLKRGVAKIKDNINEMKRVIRLAEKAKAELLRQTYTPKYIMEYAFKTGMLPTEKACIKLTLEAMDASVPVDVLAKSIMAYLKEFGSKVRNVKYYNVVKFNDQLAGLSLAKRTEYVEEITDLTRTRGTRKFIHDFEKLDDPSKKYIGKNITQGFWKPLVIVGAIATAAYITDVVADNRYNNATMSQRDLMAIANKIENGTADKAEKYIFFTNPVSEKFVATDPVYTLQFVKFASDVYQAEQVLDEMQAKETQKIQDNIENTIINNYQKTSERLNKDSQLGTL